MVRRKLVAVRRELVAFRQGKLVAVLSSATPSIQFGHDTLLHRRRLLYDDAAGPIICDISNSRVGVFSLAVVSVHLIASSISMAATCNSNSSGFMACNSTSSSPTSIFSSIGATLPNSVAECSVAFFFHEPANPKFRPSPLAD
ncbi:unnamed protein product [Cuscuta europaea]|uniref:Uncharacterized protein n=1 Tax=Cuscuta europaea TaxID=41803 RepID=A0A9P0YUB6_CUSEU|nr:unnamed protein product [Cuscuta europaea]